MSNTKTTEADQLAKSIVQRANSLNISISELCRAAKVSRRWFEYLKRRTPKAIEAYMRIEQQLTRLEAEQTKLQA